MDWVENFSYVGMINFYRSFKLKIPLFETEIPFKFYQDIKQWIEYIKMLECIDLKQRWIEWKPKHTIIVSRECEVAGERQQS